ncbi:MAG: TOTE conflict system archaeo-eukaryotic primase domain-containing protein [Ktedonobacteraceae bacterium]
MFQATEEQARLLADLFIGRQSDYALQTPDGRYRRVGCSVNLDVLQEHLNGSCTIGSYLIDEQGNCFFATFDADQENGLEILADVRRTLAGDGIPAYLEMSRRGGHLWVFFDTPAPAWAVRKWLLPYCPNGVEFYPKQDEAAGVGSLIRVPLGVHQRSGQRYPFVVRRQGKLVAVGSNVAETLLGLEEVKRATVPQALFTAYRRADRAQARRTHTLKANPSPIRSFSKTLTIADWCAGQEPFSTIGQYVTLDSRGMGCCPFGEHHRDGRDTHPSFRVFEPKRRGGNCWCCYAGGISGDVFNFLQLYHKLSASELWSWIRSGNVR